MKTLETIRSRTSTRAFLPQPVPRATITQILEAARWAPTGCNRQSWRVTVVAGEVRNTLVARLVERARARQPSLPGLGDAAAVRANAECLLADLGGIATALGMSLWEFVVAGSYGFYGAPVILIVSQLGGGRGDVDRFVTTLLLAAHDLGLGTCWLGYPLGYPDIIRDTLGIPQEETLAAAVALGYRDPASAANAYRSTRVEVEDFTRWVGLE